MYFRNNNCFDVFKLGFGNKPYGARKYKEYAGSIRILLVILSVVFLSACAVGPDFKRSETVPPVALFETAIDKNNQQSQVVVGTMETSWWTLFNDVILNDLQIRAQKGNFDLQLAASRIAQSRSLVGVANSVGLPKLSLNGFYSRAADSANGLFAHLGAPDTAYDLAQTAFDASWELDLWGYARRTKESAEAAMEASSYFREGVRVSIAAEIARNYLLFRLVQTQLDVAAQNQANAERVLELTLSREANGIGNRYESASAKAQLASVKALVPRLEEQRNALMNALALMVGEPPRALNEFLAAARGIPSVPQRVPIGLPSELARRRPDILQSEARLHAATAAIGMAKADFYPRIRLVGSAGLQSQGLENFGYWSSRFFSIGPTMHLPIFEGGRLKSMLALSNAREQEAAVAYRQTVLRAWHEVDDALNAYVLVQRRNEQLTQAQQQSLVAYDVALRRYEEGADDYMKVLLAQRSLLASEMGLAENTSQISLDMVNLYKSLGGGWAVLADDNAGVNQ